MTEDAMDGGTEIARVAGPDCRCGVAAGWVVDAVGDRVCKTCGTTYTDRQESLRELHDGDRVRGQRFYTHPLDDPADETTLITIWTGTDDQRPDHDPERGFYRPLCVADLLPSGTLYTYVNYCGKCRHKWGSLGTGGNWSYCPYCAAGIANYVFSDGILKGRRVGEGYMSSLPDIWPEDWVELWDSRQGSGDE